MKSLRLLDRAVQARFGELWSEAARFAFEARQADVQTPSADILLGELALEQGEADAVGSAARAALRRDPTSANAKLLLALREWMLRGQNGTAQAGAAANELLQQAATDELSNGAVRFFAGDFLRVIGRPRQAHTELLGGLYRQHVWHSAALLTAKLFLVREEAGPSAGLTSSALIDPEMEMYGKAVLYLRRIISDGGKVAPENSISKLIFTSKQLRALSCDQALTTALPTLGGSSPVPLPPYTRDSQPGKKSR